MPNQRAVIIGAGQAAAQCALSLRTEGWQGGISIVGAEPYLPYHRPPLSKAYLSNEISADKLPIRPIDFYQSQDIEVHLNTTIDSIDREQKQVHTTQGENIEYDKLCLATGVRARKLQHNNGADLSGIYYLRDKDDIDNIKHHLKDKPKSQVVIIGGGYIGLETAASLTKKDYQVTVVEAAERILQRVTSPVMSEFFTHLHEQNGVKILTNITLKGFIGEGANTNNVKDIKNVRAVELSDGRTITADTVIIGIGVEVNDELAKQANLTTENGIVVNAYCQTNDPDILAIGDCTWHYNPIYKRWLRLESVQNANDQAKIAAKTMVGKQPLTAYNSLPWFWSDQYHIKLQIAGLSSGYDEVKIDGVIEQYDFSVSYFQQGKLIAMDAINRPRAFMQAKKAIIQEHEHE